MFPKRSPTVEPLDMLTHILIGCFEGNAYLSGAKPVKTSPVDREMNAFPLALGVEAHSGECHGPV